MSQAITTRLRAQRFTRKDWEMLKDMTYEELEEKYGKKRAKSIMALHDLKPMELNEAILLFDSTEDMMKRGGVPISGAGYLRKKTRSVSTILSAVFAGLLTVSVAITVTSDITFARVMYTAFKVIVLLFRMAKGYDVGAKAYNTVEVRLLEAKCNYLRQYIRFVEDKTYLKLGDRYGDISCYIDESSDDLLAVAIPTTTNE